MNISAWLDKYRLSIGIILIIIIGVGLIFLLWGDGFIGKSSNQDKYISSLETKIIELETRISQLETSGQIAGTAVYNEGLGEQKDNKEQQVNKININTATSSELEKLPGIGPTRAQYIIDYRKEHSGFKTTAEIQNIKGVGPATYEKMKNMITVE